MATQSIRNIMNNSIARILPEVKKRVREEGEKKLEELQQELLSPETIIATLQPEKAWYAGTWTPVKNINTLKNLSLKNSRTFCMILSEDFH